MIKQLCKVGNSTALILDDPILELLGLEEDGQVQLTVQDGSLIVTPIHRRLASTDVKSTELDYVLKKRYDALRRLAE